MNSYKIGVTKFKRYCSFLKRCLSFMNTQLIFVNDLVVPANHLNQHAYDTTSNTNGCHIGRHLFEGTDFQMIPEFTYITDPSLVDTLEPIGKRSGMKDVQYCIDENMMYFIVDGERLSIASRVPETVDVILTFKTTRLTFDDVVNSVMGYGDSSNRIINTNKTDSLVPKLLGGNTLPIPCTHDENLVVRLSKNMFRCLTTSRTSLQFEYTTKPIINGNKLPVIVMHVWYKNDVEMIHAYSFGIMESS